MDGHWAIPGDPRSLFPDRRAPFGPSKVYVPEALEPGVFTHRVVCHEDGSESVFCSEFVDFEFDTTGLELAEYRADAWMKPSVRGHHHSDAVQIPRRNGLSLPRLLVHACFFGGVGVELVVDLIRTL